MKLGFIGSGYVGLTTGACFSSLGHSVICHDIDNEKIQSLSRGKLTLYEPGLEALIESGRKDGNLHFTTDIKKTVDESDIIFICVNTPPRKDGYADLKYVERVAKEIAQHMREYKIIVDKSTVPIRTAERVEETILRFAPAGVKFDIVSNPEFLREGRAVHDILHPSRIVIGAESSRARETMIELYRTLVKDKNIPIKITSVKSAELIKHGANTFLSAKISFANLIAEACENAGADAAEVLEAIGLDERIGNKFLKPGIGFGGSCFPKDISAFKKTLEILNVDTGFVSSIEKINQWAVERFIRKIEKVLWVIDGKTIAILGLSFKPDTDDIRNSPALKILEILEENGGRIKAHDPKAEEKVRKMYPNIAYCKNPYEAIDGAEALVLCTEWQEYKNLDLARVKGLMATPIIFDGRNALDARTAKKLGFSYYGVGNG